MTIRRQGEEGEGRDATVAPYMFLALMIPPSSGRTLIPTKIIGYWDDNTSTGETQEGIVVIRQKTRPG